MGNVSIDMSELEGLAADLLATGDRGAAAAHGAVIEVGARVQASAKAAAPTDRPWLAAQGIRRKAWKDAKGTHVDVFTVPDPEGRPSGMFVEYGTSEMPPQAFLTIQSPWAETALPAAIAARVRVFG